MALRGMRLHRVRGKETIRVLGIESTAHTIGVGIAQNRPPYILSNVKKKYEPKTGGIHPREASRFHSIYVGEVLRGALKNAGLSIKDIDAIAVALGPGLGPCLRVGATAARALSSYYHKPLVPVNHAIGHIEIGLLLSGFRDPLIVYVSGGHTSIIAFNKGRYRVFGETQDIALGNLRDVFARETGLAPPYVVDGWHVLDKCALRSDGKRLLNLPYIVKGQDVSYSGLLTAALRLWRKGEKLEDVCYSLVEISFSMITEVAERGLAHTRRKELLLTGGVSASKILSEKMERMTRLHNIAYYNVPPEYAGDNGAMIAWAGLLAFMSGIRIDVNKSFIRQRWRVDEVDVPWRK
jgi:N6-L-threonylcarbamoyladenine synthase